MNYDLWAKSHLPAGQMQPYSLVDVFMAAFFCTIAEPSRCSRDYSLQSQDYLCSGILQKKFADFYSGGIQATLNPQRFNPTEDELSI